MRYTQTLRRIALTTLATVALLGASLHSVNATNTLPTHTQSVGTFGLNYGTSTRWGAGVATNKVLIIGDNDVGKAAVRALSSTIPLAHYIDVNVQTYDTYYSGVNKSESSFVHVSDPASLTVTPKTTTSVYLDWFDDQRLINGTIPDIDDYYVYYRLGAGSWVQIASTGGSTAMTKQSLAAATQYSFRVTSHSASLGELPYSGIVTFTTSAVPSFTIRPGLTSKTEIVTPSDTLVLNVRAFASTGTTDLTLYVDKNGDRDYADAGESVAMTLTGAAPSGYVEFNGIVGTPVTHSSNGFQGFAWKVGSPSHATIFLPASGSFSTGVNNRIRQIAYRTSMMDDADTTWTRYLQNYIRSKITLGYDGFFIDDVIHYVDTDWDVSAPASYQTRYIAAQDSFLTRMRNAASPGFILYNGLADDETTHFARTDGSFTEGFIIAPWKANGASDTDFWKSNLNAVLHAQAYSVTTFLHGISDTTSISNRTYGLAAYLLVRNSRTYWECDALVNGNSTLKVWDWPENHVALGLPVETFTDIMQAFHHTNDGYTNLFKRKFASGFVLVNADNDSTFTATFPRARVVTITGSSQLGYAPPAWGGVGALTTVYQTSITLAPRRACLVLYAFRTRLRTHISGF